MKTKLLSKVAGIKDAEKGTERSAEIGMVIGVEEKKDVPSSIKTPMSTKKEVIKEVKAKTSLVQGV